MSDPHPRTLTFVTRQDFVPCLHALQQPRIRSGPVAERDEAVFGLFD
jgi:hypothetical protein